MLLCNSVMAAIIQFLQEIGLTVQIGQIDGATFVPGIAIDHIGSQSEALQQDTYTFAHAALGRFDLFIVPAQAVDHEARYIATINRL